MLIDQIALELGLTREFIRSLASGASYEYKKYTIKKKNGGDREIFHPSRKLKAIQTWVLRNALSSLRVHGAATAYRRGQSILDNASKHVKQRYLLRLDLQDFFPSIVEADFRKYVEDDADLAKRWQKEDVDLLVAILFRHGKLTIGAPTSPALSNALCFALDSELTSATEKRGIIYTRYADDLFFSAYNQGVLAAIESETSAILRTLKYPASLHINKVKTVHSSKKKKRQVTGLTLGSDEKVHVSRAYKRKIRAMVHGYDQLGDVDKVALPGMISFVAGFEPQFLNALITKYGFDLIHKVTQLRPLLERQQIHLPKVKPSPSRKGRKSSIEILKDILKEAGFGET